MVGAAWPSARLAVVFSVCRKEPAKNVCRPYTQNVAGHKEFIRGIGQAIGGGVQKAERGPNWYELYLECLSKSQGVNLPFWRHVCGDSNTPKCSSHLLLILASQEIKKNIRNT